MQKPESGRTMIEMIAVLAIIGLLTVGALAGYLQASLKYKMGKTIDEIQQISTDVYQLCRIFRTYTGCATTAALCENEIILNCTDNDTPMNPFGGTYNLTSQNDTFTLTINDLEADVCTQLVDEATDWQHIVGPNAQCNNNTTFIVNFK